MTPFALNIYDVNIVWNNGKDLKAKVLPLIDVLCIGDQGLMPTVNYGAKSSTIYNFGHHINMQFN